jgi:hypothetical protein
MSAFVGDLWSSVNRFASQARLNVKSILVGTGDQILAKSPGQLIDGMLASVTADSAGGSLKKGNVIQWDGDSWNTPEGTAHTHTSTADGGDFQNILIKAIENTWFVNKMGLTKEQFYQTGTGATYTNVVSAPNAYVEIATGTTSSNNGNLRYGGFTLSFASPSAFITRIQLASTTTSVTARCGMNMEASNDVTNNKVKYGFEGCSGCNDTFMSIISSDGTTRSKNTQSSDTFSGVGNYMMKLDPGVNVKYRKEAGSIITKTTHIPNSGVSDRSNSWICGIQTTTTSSRTLHLYGLSLVGAHGDTMPSI